MIRILPLALAAALIAAPFASVQAQEVIPTAAASQDNGAPPAPAASDAPIKISHERQEHDDRGPAPRGPCGGVPDANGKMDKSPHGEVYAGAGTHGYNQVGGAVCVPVGDNTAVTIAVDRSQFRGRGW